MMDQTELVSAVEALTEAVGELSDRLDVQQGVLGQQKRMIADIEKQRSGLHSTRIVLSAAVFGIILDLGLTVGFGLLYRQVDANTREVQKVQARTSSEILCPLYEVFATSIKVNPPNPNLSPEQARARHEAADTILAGLDKLGCV